MIKANFNTYNRYVTDSVYQWDIDQVLTVNGLNLAVAPEVHFSNANTDRAIPRQTVKTDKGFTVKVPNSLLQEPFSIYAHVGIYEGKTFKVIEVVEIPVKPRKRPLDYKLEDSDEEVYSFKKLENTIANMVTKAEAKVITARIDSLITHNNDTDGNSELIDMRVGVGGKQYDSAGAAIRSQILELDNSKANVTVLNDLINIIDYSYQYLDYEIRTEGEYWDGINVKTAEGYYRYPVVFNLPKGRYYWGGLSSNFTVFENVKTGVLTKLSAFSSTADNYITVDYDFNLYATVSLLSTKGEFGRGEKSKTYKYGVYDVSYKEAENVSRVFYCGPTRDITKLKDAIEKAEEYYNSILYVDKATYNLIDEYGEDFFEKYSLADGTGIVLKNNIHIIFEQGAKVTCNYYGDNSLVHTYFSPFNAGEYGFTLENVYVESTNTRYTMHDERSGAPIPYRNIYKRCTFIHDSSSTSWGAHQALGGGLGCYGDIEITDCYMSSENCTDVLTYHNAGYENPGLTEYKSNIVIRNCYIEGTIRVNSTGYSKLITNAYVSGNSLTSEPLSGKTTEDSEVNISLKAWNNDIRS